MSPRSVVSMVKKVGPEPNSESKSNRTVESRGLIFAAFLEPWGGSTFRSKVRRECEG